MKDLKFYIKEIKPNTGSKWKDYPLIVLLIMIGICLLPLLLLVWGIAFLYDLLLPNEIVEGESTWHKIKTGADFELKYQWLTGDLVPGYIRKHLDESALIKLRVPLLTVSWIESRIKGNQTRREEGE